MKRVEVSLRQRTQPGTRSYGAFEPGCSSFLAIYGPLEAALPFVLPNKLAPDFQVSQGLGKHLSRLVPSLCVCLLDSHLGSVHRQALPLRLSGSLHPLQPQGPTCRCTRVGVSPSTKSLASLHSALNAALTSAPFIPTRAKIPRRSRAVRQSY